MWITFGEVSRVARVSQVPRVFKGIILRVRARDTRGTLGTRGTFRF